MLTLIRDLVIDRVDLVDEGANSAAFIELYKRKEQRMEFSEILNKMKPEHAEVLQKVKDDLEETISKQKEELDEANEALEKCREELNTANEELEILKAKESEYCECDGECDEDGMCKACGKPKKKTAKASGTGFDETEVLKAMPENVKEAYVKMREQKEAAEEQVRKAAAEKLEQEAIAKAATLKSLPIEQSELVEVLKSCDAKFVDILTAAATAIDEAVLGEVGKRNAEPVQTDAWEKIEAEALKIAERDNITKQKAVGIVIKEKPELYKEYLEGGAE